MDWVADFFDGDYQGEYLDYASDAERTAREVEFIAAQLGVSSQSRVLDLACGNGRHALALSKRVAHVTGVDRTRQFIRVAEAAQQTQEVTNVHFVLDDMRELDYESEFDAAYNYFTAWGYYGDDENLDVLRRVWRALKPGGRFLLEMIHRDALVRGFKPQNFVVQQDGTVLLEERRLDLATGRSHNRRTYLRPDGTREELCFDHYIPSADALVRHLRTAGFSTLTAVEAPTGIRLTMDSWRLAVIGTK